MKVMVFDVPAESGGASLIIDKGKYYRDTVNNIPFVFVKSTDYRGNGISRIKNMYMFYKNLFTVSKEYAKKFGSPNIILASSVHPLTMVAGIKIAKKFKIPCICEIRDLWPEAIFFNKMIKENSLIGKLLLKGEHWIYKKADALIFTQEGYKDYLLEKKWDAGHGGDIDLSKTYHINNGLDIEQFYNSINENVLVDADLDTELFNVVYVGSIRLMNNIGNLLDSAKILKNYKGIQFLIYGDGDHQVILEQRVIDEKITNVKMKGSVDKKFIPYILSKSSVNILNYSQSLFNWARGSSANKLFEYMASGKPIISTIKTGYSTIEKYNCGVEINACTPQELANEIIRFKNMQIDEYNTLGDNAKKGAEDFDFKIHTEKLIKVINSVITL